MSQRCTLAILSDIHYAGPGECARRDEAFRGIGNPLTRLAVKAYRHFIWLRDPFAHNHLLDQFVNRNPTPDYVIANGDFSCDSAYIGVSDPSAFQSAELCLEKLRRAYAPRLLTTYGDHELGKKKLGCNEGGLRLQSWHRARNELGLEPFWQLTLGDYVLLGMVSTLAALPVYEAEILPEELAAWRALRAEHLMKVEAAFSAIHPGQRILLFCHDPTALPFLARLPAVQARWGQFERTIIGHLHSDLILKQTRWLAGMPHFPYGHTFRRMSMALREARHWKPFHVLLCPSLSGIELLKDGAYYTVELNLGRPEPLQFVRHAIPR
jgi:hypothetical protein